MTEEIEIQNEEEPLGVRMFRENFKIRFPDQETLSKCDKCDNMINYNTMNIAIDGDAPYNTVYALCGRCFTQFKIDKTQSQ